MATTTVAGGYPCLGEGSPPNARDELADATEDYGDIIRNVVRENVNAMLIGTSTHFIRARTFRHWAEVCLATVPGRPSLRINCDFKLELDFTAPSDRGDGRSIVEELPLRGGRPTLRSPLTTPVR